MSTQRDLTPMQEYFLARTIQKMARQAEGKDDDLRAEFERRRSGGD